MTFFWWKDILKLVDQFREVTWIHVNQGDIVLFRADHWKIRDSVIPLKDTYSRLFSFVEVFNCQDLTDMFHLPLSEQAYAEYLTVQVLMSTHGR